MLSVLVTSAPSMPEAQDLCLRQGHGCLVIRSCQDPRAVIPGHPHLRKNDWGGVWMLRPFRERLQVHQVGGCPHHFQGSQPSLQAGGSAL